MEDYVTLARVAGRESAKQLSLTIVMRAVQHRCFSHVAEDSGTKNVLSN